MDGLMGKVVRRSVVDRGEEVLSCGVGHFGGETYSFLNLARLMVWVESGTEDLGG